MSEDQDKCNFCLHKMWIAMVYWMGHNKVQITLYKRSAIMLRGCSFDTIIHPFIAITVLIRISPRFDLNTFKGS